jgi:hypothetical protein
MNIQIPQKIIPRQAMDNFSAFLLATQQMMSRSLASEIQHHVSS